MAADADVAALASMFRTDRQAGLAFPTAVLPFNCDSDEHAGRAICQSVPGLALCLLGQERSLLRP